MLRSLILWFGLVAIAQAQVMQIGILIVPVSGPPTAATPTFSPGAGTYSSAQTVTISTSTPLAVLCYTTDGSTPTEVANLCSGGTTATYTTPITVSTTQTVKAIATLASYTDSSVGSATYTIIMTYTDNFPGSSLSGNWTCYAGSGYEPAAVASNQVSTNQTISGFALCGYTGGTFTTGQVSQFTIGSAGANGNNGSPCVNMNASSGNGYCGNMGGQSGTNDIQKVTAGALTDISGFCGGAPSVGDVVTLTNNGSGVLTYRDVTTSTNLCTATDTTYTGGVAGFSISVDNGHLYTTLASFVGTP